MQYHVSRSGQTYGPYTLEDLQKYVASGNVLPTDLAKSEEMTEWAPVSQVLGASMPAAAVAAPVYVPGVAPVYAPGAAMYPDPPNLHWALVLLIGVFTCGLFIGIWDIVQAAWMRKVNPRSNAMMLYILGWIISIAGSSAQVALLISSGGQSPYSGLGSLASLASAVLIIVARFDMRRHMEEHFNGPEPIGLSLSGVMTFFFGSLYFQYHFTRINEMKRAARYPGTAI